MADLPRSKRKMTRGGGKYNIGISDIDYLKKAAQDAAYWAGSHNRGTGGLTDLTFRKRIPNPFKGLDESDIIKRKLLTEMLNSILSEDIIESYPYINEFTRELPQDTGKRPAVNETPANRVQAEGAGGDDWYTTLVGG